MAGLRKSFSMYYVYILENKSGRRYIGQTDSLEQRLARHNSDKVFSTQNRGPWEIVYTKPFFSRSEAMNFEKYLKKQKGGKGFKKILEDRGAPV